MKKFRTTIIALFFPVLMFSQLAFMPVGAAYVSKKTWSTNGPPSSYHYFQVTEDTTIQGKYCTRLQDGDWPISNGSNKRTYVHQDGQQIYRFDLDSQEFKLVLDYSKQVGESWQVEVDEFLFGADTVTFTVTEVNGMLRRVNIAGGTGFINGVVFYEGFGGLHYSRLVMSAYWVIFKDPSSNETIICYQDPVEGVVFGNGEQCIISTNDDTYQSIGMSIYPNPVADVLNFQLKARQSSNHAALRILNAEGRVLEEIKSVNPQTTYTLPIWDWPQGMYFLQYHEVGEVRAVERFVVAH